MFSKNKLFAKDKLILMAAIAVSYAGLLYLARTAGLADGQLEKTLIALASGFVGYGAQQLYLVTRKGNA